MTPLDALRSLTARALEAKEEGHSTTPVPPGELALGKQAVVAKCKLPEDLAELSIFLDATGLLTIAGVSLY